MLNFSIAYGKTPIGLAKDWKVSSLPAKLFVATEYVNVLFPVAGD